MRSPALKQLLFLLIFSLMLGISSSDARTPVSIRFIAGASQAGVYKVNGVTDDPNLLLGIGARYRLNERHSFFLDIERIDKRTSSASIDNHLTDFALSREPLTAPDYVTADYWPVTLGYQFDFYSAANHLITPHVSCGFSMMIISENAHDGPLYPNLDVNAGEKIEHASTKAAAKFGATLGIGFSVRASSALSISLNASFRELGTAKPRTVEPGRRSVNPFWPLPLNDGYEAKLILEYQI